MSETPRTCEQCGLTPEQAKHKKSCFDHQSFAPVVPRWNPVLGEDRIELHWYAWHGPIDGLPPLCDLTRAQAGQLVLSLRSLLEIDPRAEQEYGQCALGRWKDVKAAP